MSVKCYLKVKTEYNGYNFKWPVTKGLAYKRQGNTKGIPYCTHMLHICH